MSEDVLRSVVPVADAAPPPSTTSTHYVKVWGVLLGLFLASVGAAFLGARTLSAILVFTLATAKAVVVLSYFMHLKLEPRWVALLMASVFALVAILFGALVPDILYVHGG